MRTRALFNPLPISASMSALAQFSSPLARRKWVGARAAMLLGLPAMLMSLTGCAAPGRLGGFPQISPAAVRGQSPDQEPSAGLTLDQVANEPASEQPAAPEGAAQSIVADVVVRGNQRLPAHRILANVRTRPGRYFDPDVLQQDVNQLWRMDEIRRVNGPWIEQTEAGVVVTIEVVEKQTLESVQIIGNRAITDRRLKKEAGITDGQPLDVFEIKMVKSRIEDFYREQGFPNTQVEILEGGGESDSSVVLVIHEDQKQRVWNVKFEGNTIATDARLKTFVKSKPGVFWLFGGVARRDEIDQDIQKLMTYYRSLGFFNARIGREISESNDGRWLTTTYIIDEGPRYRVRSVAFMGNQRFTPEELASLVRLKPDEAGSPEFNAAKMNEDVVTLRDLYGSMGYVFSQVEAEPRFLEQPGELDLVYRIEEGEQYHVGKINVHIDGNYGVTRRETVLNRLSLRPGDLIDVREVRNSERRLGSAQIFAGNDPGTPGAPPRIVVKPPELRELERMAESMGGPEAFR